MAAGASAAKAVDVLGAATAAAAADDVLNSTELPPELRESQPARLALAPSSVPGWRTEARVCEASLRRQPRPPRRAAILAQRKIPVQHYNAQCRVCLQYAMRRHPLDLFVRGPLHSCLQCADYDLCDACFSIGNADAHASEPHQWVRVASPPAGDHEALLHEAVVRASGDVAASAVTKLADPAVLPCDANGTSVAVYAAMRGHVNVLKALVAADNKAMRSLAFRTHRGASLAHIAAFYGHVSVLEYLRSLGLLSDEAVPSCVGESLLTEAMQGGHVSVLTWLTKHRAMRFVDASEVVDAGLSANLDVLKWLASQSGISLSAGRSSGGETALHLASIHGFASALTFLIGLDAKGAEQVNLESDDGSTPLLWAARLGHADAVRALLLAGARVNHAGTGISPLYAACLAGEREIVNLLLQPRSSEPVDVSQRSQLDGSTALHAACWSGDRAIIDMLAKRAPALVNVATDDGVLPIHVAAAQGSAEVVQLLIEQYAAAPAACTASGLTPLLVAGRCRSASVMRYLVQKAQVAIAGTDLDGRTPLHHAAAVGDLDVLRAAGAAMRDAVDLGSGSGASTPLHAAARFGHANVVRALVSELHATVFVEDRNGYIPLHCGCLHGSHVAVVKELLRLAPDFVNFTSRQRETALLLASHDGNTTLVRTLLDAGADMSIPSLDGTLPLHAAAAGGNLPVLKLLLERGADVRATTHTGATALHLAAQYNRLDVAQFLATKKGMSRFTADDTGLFPLFYALRATTHVPAARRLMPDLLRALGPRVGSDSADDVKAMLENRDEFHSVLQLSVHPGKTWMLDMVLNWGARPYVRTGDGNTTLHLVTVLLHSPYHADMIRSYSRLPADMQLLARNNAGESIALIAADSGDTVMLRWTIGGLSPTERNDLLTGVTTTFNRNTVYHLAAASSNPVDVLTLLLSMRPPGQRINFCNSAHQSVMFAAVLEPGPSRVLSLLAQADSSTRADSAVPLHEIPDKNGTTVTMQLARHGRTRDLRYLLDELKGEAIVSDQDGLTPLHYAARAGSLACVQLLLHGDERRSAVSMTSVQGATPLHFAAAAGHVRVVEALLAAGAPVDARDSRGAKAFLLACHAGHCQVALKLLPAHPGAAVDLDGLTALHHAARHGHLALAEAVCRSERDACLGIAALPDVGAWLPIHIAAIFGRLPVLRWLIEHRGAHAASRDHIGRTAVALATAFRARDVALYLVRTVAVAKNADAWAADQHAGLYPLLFAAAQGDLELTRALADAPSDSAITKVTSAPAASRKHGICVQHAAARHPGVLAYLVKRFGIKKLHVLDASKATPLHYASRGGAHAIEYMLSLSGADATARMADGWTPLHFACLRGSLRSIKALTSGRYAKDSSYINSFGGAEQWTPLHVAGIYSDVRVTMHLISSCGADPRIKSRTHSTALHVAARAGAFRVVQYLIDKAGLDASAPAALGATPLHLAAESGVLKLVRWLVEVRGVQADLRMHNGATPLHQAVATGRAGAVERWLTTRYMPTSTTWCDDQGETVMHYAVRCNNLAMVQFLLTASQDARLMTARSKEGFTPVHDAVASERVDILRFLVTLAPPVLRIPDAKGQLPLMIAAGTSNLELVVLTMVGLSLPQVAASRIDGATALHIAVQTGSLEVFRQLCSVVDPRFVPIAQLRDQQGNSILHYAAMNGVDHLVHYLVFSCAHDRNPVNEQGMTPLMLAALHGHTDVVDLLVQQAGVNPALQFGRGVTCLHVAAFGGHVELCKRLVRVHRVHPDITTTQQATAIMYAARGGQLGTLRWLIERERARLDAVDVDGASVLHSAAEVGSVPIMRYLVRTAGVDIRLVDMRGLSSLHYAVRGGSLRMVRWLLRHGADRYLPENTRGDMPLHFAAISGDIDVMMALLREHPRRDAEVRNAKSFTLLHCAAGRGNTPLVKRLISMDVDLNALDESGNTALHLAAYNGHADLVKYLLTNKLYAAATTNKNGHTVFHASLNDNTLGMVRFLSEHDRDVLKAPSKDGYYPVHWIVSTGNDVVLRYLLDGNLATLDQRTSDERRFTPLIVAAKEGAIECAHLLLTRGTPVDLIDSSGESALFQAVRNGNSRTAQYLLHAGASISLRNSSRQTVLHAAAGTGRGAVLRVLLLHGAERIVNEGDKDGATPLHVAVEAMREHEEHDDTVRILVRAGADPRRKNKAGVSPLKLAQQAMRPDLVASMRPSRGGAIVAALRRASTAVRGKARGKEPAGGHGGAGGVGRVVADAAAPPEQQRQDEKPKCTLRVHGESEVIQPGYQCWTCQLIVGRMACRACALTCHKGHDVELVAEDAVFACDCGQLQCVRSRKPPALLDSLVVGHAAGASQQTDQASASAAQSVLVDLQDILPGPGWPVLPSRLPSFHAWAAGRPIPAELDEPLGAYASVFRHILDDGDRVDDNSAAILRAGLAKLTAAGAERLLLFMLSGMIRQHVRGVYRQSMRVDEPDIRSVARFLNLAAALRNKLTMLHQFFSHPFTNLVYAHTLHWCFDQPDLAALLGLELREAMARESASGQRDDALGLLLILIVDASINVHRNQIDLRLLPDAYLLPPRAPLLPWALQPLQASAADDWPADVRRRMVDYLYQRFVIGESVADASPHRVVFLGNAGSGKTSLALAVSQYDLAPLHPTSSLASLITAKRMPGRTDTAHAGDVTVADWSCRVPLKIRAADEVFTRASPATMTLSLWDTRGALPLHMLLLHDDSLCVITFSMQDADPLASVLHWLSVVHARAPRASVVLVATHCEGSARSQSSLDSLNTALVTLVAEWRQALQDASGSDVAVEQLDIVENVARDLVFFPTACAGDAPSLWYRIEDLREAVIALAWWRQRTSPYMPAAYAALTSFCAELRHDDAVPPFLLRRDFEARFLASQDVAKRAMAQVKHHGRSLLSSAIEYAHAAGQLVAFDTSPLSKWIVLDPQWLSTLLSSASTRPSGGAMTSLAALGVVADDASVSLADLQRAWSAPSLAALLRWKSKYAPMFLDLLLDFAALVPSPGKKQMYLAVQNLPATPSQAAARSMPAQASNFGPRLVRRWFRIHSAPPGLICHVLRALHRLDIAGGKAVIVSVWRSGVLLRSHHGELVSVQLQPYAAPQLSLQHMLQVSGLAAASPRAKTDPFQMTAVVVDQLARVYSYFPGLSLAPLVPCLHCTERLRASDVCLFPPAALAASKSGTSLYCVNPLAKQRFTPAFLEPARLDSHCLSAAVAMAPKTAAPADAAGAATDPVQTGAAAAATAATTATDAATAATVSASAPSDAAAVPRARASSLLRRRSSASASRATSLSSLRSADVRRRRARPRPGRAPWSQQDLLEEEAAKEAAKVAQEAKPSTPAAIAAAAAAADKDGGADGAAAEDKDSGGTGAGKAPAASSVRVRQLAAARVRQPVIWAVIIGVSKYGSGRSVSGAAADATALHDAMLQLGVDKSRVRLLLDRQATHAAILKVFSWLKKQKILRGDHLLIYFAGMAVDLSSEVILAPVDHVWNQPRDRGLAVEQLRYLGMQLPVSLHFVLDLSGGVKRAFSDTVVRSEHPLEFLTAVRDAHAPSLTSAIVGLLSLLQSGALLTLSVSLHEIHKRLPEAMRRARVRYGPSDMLASDSVVFAADATAVQAEIQRAIKSAALPDAADAADAPAASKRSSDDGAMTASKLASVSNRV